MSDFTIGPPVRRTRPQHAPRDLAAFFDGGPQVRMQVGDEVLAGLRMHARRHATEAGGVLLGRRHEADGRFLVVVSDFVAVPSDNASTVHFEFDLASLAALHARLDDAVDEYVVGWFHSHTVGEPFMSVEDHRLHRNHFRDPWYVSAVVSTRPWGMPVGFWHFDGDDIQPLESYDVKVADEAGPGTHRETSLRAAGLSPDPLSLPSGLSELMGELGVSGDSNLRSVLEALDLDHSPNRPSPTRLLQDVLWMATVLADNPKVVDELAHARAAAGRAVVFSEVMTPALISLRLQEHRVSAQGRRCIGYRPGTSDLDLFLLDGGHAWPMSLPYPVQAACLDTEERLWGFVDETTVVHVVPTAESDLASDSFAYVRREFEVPALTEPADQVAAGNQSLWVTGERTWARFDFGEESTTLRPEAVPRGDLPVPGARLVMRVDADGEDRPLLVAAVDGVLRSWRIDDRRWEPAAETPLPEPWQGDRVADACLGGEGLVLHLDDGRLGRLVVVGVDGLDLRHQFLRDGNKLHSGRIRSLTADELGRTYVLIGPVLFRLNA